MKKKIYYYTIIISKNDDKKQRKVAVEYVKLCGYGQGGDRKSNCQVGTLKLSEIAKQLGTSKNHCPHNSHRTESSNKRFSC